MLTFRGERRLNVNQNGKPESVVIDEFCIPLSNLITILLIIVFAGFVFGFSAGLGFKVLPWW
jgi:hypothetical protein